MPPDVPRLFVQWETFLGWLLGRTEKFPKSMRSTLTSRIENCALDVFEGLIEARFKSKKDDVLARVSLDLEILRLLLRLAHDRRALDHAAFSHACAELDTAGRMLGGWIRSRGEGT